MKEFVPVGRIGRLFGTDGGLTVSLYDTLPEEINTKEPLFVTIDGLAVPLFIESMQRKGRSKAVVVFSDIDNPDRATELIGMEVLAERDTSQVDPPAEREGDELYFEDLIGFIAVIVEVPENLPAGERVLMGVSMTQKRELPDDKPTAPLMGRVEDYIDSEMNPLFVIKCGDDEIYIPAVEEFITGIDMEARELTLSVPEGLAGLNISE